MLGSEGLKAWRERANELSSIQGKLCREGMCVPSIGVFKVSVPMQRAKKAFQSAIAYADKTGVSKVPMGMPCMQCTHSAHAMQSFVCRQILEP